ncbi:MAG TPA: serine/threonine-protein kinase [Phycisphaerae bacterium]|nr:serine/threonine-protein kinase [Phycisphaerae bacterium]HOJ76192.1 serine/threonine-protein kinase [Phycisphaerae bacterium]HOM53518.1 serine/threonine-protein kinase [Phycisphaerae bacterium]HON65214.1 serine/threonine-protein kinase [Phycisphaerae bacterium]HOQ86639.1 serine/threonine-protein kinase [Phycisphaerae bacterium]
MNRPQPGDRINNYLLDQKIGTGSFSEVWKAHHHVFRDVVAIKIPTDPQYVRYLQRDGVAIHGLRHPNIVRALDMDPYGDPPYLIMEYVDGPSLRQLIDTHPGGLPVPVVLPIMLGVLSALEAAHEAGLIHSDIKPGNVLIAGGIDLASLEPGQVKVADFGLGRRTNAQASLVQSGSLAVEDGQRISGTLAYMSPEQREGLPIDARTDLYAVGVVLHELLTGVLPQGADSPSIIRPDLPRWIDEFFHRCYTHRDRRFESAGQMKSIIERHAPTERSGPPPLGGRVRGVMQIGRSVVCAVCQEPVELGDQFCIHCGRQLVDEIPRCPSCHGFVGREDNFCILCGTDLRQLI